MKHIFTILTVMLFFASCQKEDLDSRDVYAGSWDFEVIYTSNVNGMERESVFNCQGSIDKVKDSNTLALHYCNNDVILITISEDGVVYSEDFKVIGVIDNETCLIVDQNPSEKTISEITIKGVK